MLNTEQGTQAIIDLYAIHGDEVSRNFAEWLWEEIGTEQKEQTEIAHAHLCSGFPKIK